MRGWPIVALSFAVVVLAPVVSGGSADDPEIVDVVGDVDHPLADIQKAWVERPGAGGLLFVVQVGQEIPQDLACTDTRANYFAGYRFVALGADGERSEPEFDSYVLRAHLSCQFSLVAPWVFTLQKQTTGACQNCFASVEDVDAQIDGQRFVFSPTMEQLGLADADAFELANQTAHAQRAIYGTYPGTPFVPFDQDAAPDDGFGRPFVVSSSETQTNGTATEADEDAGPVNQSSPAAGPAQAGSSDTPGPGLVAVLLTGTAVAVARRRVRA